VRLERELIERRCVDLIAEALGGVGWLNPRRADWPDAWIHFRVADEDVPVETVDARPPTGTEPTWKEVNVALRIAAAVREKIERRPRGVESSILGVHLEGRIVLDPIELEMTAKAIGDHPFKTIWIVNAQLDAALRLM
jgi:hypothetical protein